MRLLSSRRIITNALGNTSRTITHCRRIRSTASARCVAQDLYDVITLCGTLALAGAQPGTFYSFNFAYELSPVRIDGLSLIFGYIFHIAATLSVIFAWHNEDVVEQMAGLSYAGAGIGAVFAGDLITLFIYWEAMAITSVFMIWARRTDAAYNAGMRYLIV